MPGCRKEPGGRLKTPRHRRRPVNGRDSIRGWRPRRRWRRNRCGLWEAGATPAPTTKPDPMPRPAPRRGALPGQCFRSGALRRAPRASQAHGDTRKTLPLRRLPSARAGLQPLRPRPALLHPRLCRTGPAHLLAGGRTALSSQLQRAPAACFAPAPLPCAATRSDASRFPACGLACSTGCRRHRPSRRAFGGLALPLLWPGHPGIRAPGFPAVSDSPSPV